MITGKRAFDGDDMSDTLANILKSEPGWNTLPSDTPATVRRLLKRCLEKDPKRRVQDIGDARLDLEEKDLPVAATPLPANRHLLNGERLAWAFLAVLLAGVLGYIVVRAPPPLQVVRFQIGPPENSSFGSSSGIGRADGTSGEMLSPD